MLHAPYNDSFPDTPENSAFLDGLIEQLQAQAYVEPLEVAGEIPPPPIAELMGFTLVSVEEGHALFRGEQRRRGGEHERGKEKSEHGEHSNGGAVRLNIGRRIGKRQLA